MGTRSARFSQIVGIKSLDVRIFMALAKRLIVIFLIESLRTLAQYLHPTPVERLAATTYTTTRTCHNFDSMIGRCAAFNFFNQFAGIAQTVGDPYSYRGSVEIYCRTANAFQSAEFFEIDLGKRLFRV